MHDHKSAKIKYYHWPNILAVDAVAIALAWLWVFSTKQSAQLSFAAYLVLALSVWLTYQSDRLFDVARRNKVQLLSARHQFAKRHLRPLWLIWFLIFFITLVIALTGLNSNQLLKGFALLIICLAYTGGNQILSKSFFPKEPLVALIFATATQVFLPESTEWRSLSGYVLLCLINCLLIGWKERSTDDMLKVRSVTKFLNQRWANPLLFSGLGLALYSDFRIALIPSMLALAWLHYHKKSHSEESFRVLCDAALLIGPILYLFAVSFG